MLTHAAPARSEQLDATAVAVVFAGAAAIAALLAVVSPDGALLSWLLAYKVVSQLTSFIVFEPAILYAAKLYDPVTIAVVAGVGSVAGGLLDYWLLGPLMNMATVRKWYADRSWFRTGVRWFSVAPFATLAIAALTPIPFIVFKALAVTSGYSTSRYVAATVLARVPRAWAIAYFGKVVLVPDWLIAGLLAGYVASWFISRLRRLRDHVPDAPSTPNP